jgi:hypothetical protein
LKFQQKEFKRTIKLKGMERKREEQLKKLQMQVLKTQKAEFRHREKESKYGRLREGVQRTLERPQNIKERAVYETAQYKRQQVGRDREKMRAEMEAEREYQRKFGVQQEGQGELPFYEKEYQKPLPKKDIKEEKKSLKERLFG